MSITAATATAAGEAVHAKGDGGNSSSGSCRKIQVAVMHGRKHPAAPFLLSLLCSVVLLLAGRYNLLPSGPNAVPLIAKRTTTQTRTKGDLVHQASRQRRHVRLQSNHTCMAQHLPMKPGWLNSVDMCASGPSA